MKTKEDPVLVRCGLTKEQVRKLTVDMRPDWSPCPATEDPGKYLYNFLKKWGGRRISEVEFILSLHSPAAVIREWNEKYPSKQITVDTFRWQGSDISFYVA